MKRKSHTMKSNNEPTKTSVRKLLNNIKKDLCEKRYVNPQYFRENQAYFQRQAELMD